MQKELSRKKQFPGEKIWKAHLQAWRKSGLSGMASLPSIFLQK
jgi:hypothetical protein